MTYKLKDEELRKKLDELTDGGLSYALKNNNVLDLSCLYRDSNERRCESSACGC